MCYLTGAFYINVIAHCVLINILVIHGSAQLFDFLLLLNVAPADWESVPNLLYVTLCPQLKKHLEKLNVQ